MNPVAEQIMRTVIAGEHGRQFCFLHSNSKVEQIIDYRKIQDYI
jgi:hypothetical protein